MIEPLYFGCRAYDAPGHYLFSPGMRYADDDLFERLRDSNDTHLDGGYLKAQKVPDVPGRAAFIQVNGYSIVTWWDRSGDKRGGSNSAFILSGDHTPQEVMRQGAEYFPDVLKRQSVSITLPDGTALT